MKKGAIITPTKGMSRDVLPSRIEKGYSWTNKNICDYKGATMGGWSTESGTNLVSILGSYPIGDINVGKDSTVLFMPDNRIILWDFILNTFTTLLEEEELNFSTQYPIHGVSKVIKGCERVIYFTDFNNPVRAINIDNIEQYYEDTVFVEDRIKLSRPIDFVNVSNVQVYDSGGSLAVGSYRFAYRFVDTDGNTTAWSGLSNRINIVEDSTSADWNTIDGAQNLEEYTEEEGGRPSTNKRIGLTFEDLTTDFESVQVVVVPFTQGLATPGTPYALQPRPISSSRLTIYITGSDSEAFEDITFTELITEKLAINKAKTIEQHDKSLWIANIEEEVQDWAAYQRAANKIRVKIKKEQIPALEVVKGNSKHPINGSLIPGEVVPLAVQFLLANGTKSPAFHIPGRASVGVERNIVSIWSQNIEHIASQSEFEESYGKSESEATTKPVIRNFQVRDYIVDEGNDIYSTAYYEGTTTYPTSKGCDGTYVFATDADGNELNGNFIRHHKVPSRSEIPMVEKVDDVLYINNLTFDFSNIEYPSEDVIGHVILQGVREEQDRTIIDAGYLFPMKERSSNDIQWWKDTVFSNDLVPTAHRFVGHHSYIDGLQDGDYLRVEYEVAVTSTDNSFVNWDSLRGGLLDFSPNIGIRNLLATYIDHDITNLSTQGNYKIEGAINIAPYSTNFTGLSLQTQNKNQCDDMIVLELARDYNHTSVITKIPYVTIRRVINPFDNLDAITYVPMQVDISTESTNAEIFSENVTSMFSSFLVQHPNDFFDNSGNQGSTDYVVQYYSGLWTDGYYNASLLHSGTGDCNDRYLDIASDEASDYADPNEIPYYAIFRVAVITEAGNEFIEREPGTKCSEYYQYNYDFTSFNTSTPIFPLLSTYDYCKDCEGRRPDHLLFSQRDDQEDSIDNYRIFLPNDYRKIDDLGSKINKVLANNDNLYTWTDNHLYLVPTKAQEIQTNENTVFLGTGDRLSIPPQKLMELMPTYGGSEQIQGIIRTPVGIFFACPNRGAVYVLGDKMEEISGVRMKTWFRDHLPLQLKKYAAVLDEHVQYDWSVGISLGYDPFHNRVILHKKDYIPKFTVYTDGDTLIDGRIFFRNNGFYRYKARTIGENSPWIPVEFTNTSYFEDKSYTISFSLNSNAWLSFHDWRPDYMLSLDTRLITAKDDTLWEHNNPGISQVYGSQLTTLINMVFNEEPLIEKQFIDLSYRADQPFDRIWIYNDRYSTGNQTLSEQRGFTTYSGAPSTLQRNHRDKWSINKFTSYLTTTPTTDGDFIEPSAQNTDFLLTQYSIQPVQGRYAFINFYNDTAPITLEDVEIFYRKAQL